jgi:hypothetical protein
VEARPCRIDEVFERAPSRSIFHHSATSKCRKAVENLLDLVINGAELGQLGRNPPLASQPIP